MSFNFNPTDGLLNVNEFPTNPASETEARNQFMTLFNQVRDYLNNGIDATKLNGKKASDFSPASHTHDYLPVTGKASDASKINGKKITISQTQPSSPSVGDVWISW